MTNIYKEILWAEVQPSWMRSELRASALGFCTKKKKKLSLVTSYGHVPLHVQR